ncbi:MAG: cyclic pyranopterin monophosphate synthase MoaC [Leucobacter sp.]
MTEHHLTHLRADGSAHMVDVTEKAVTKRTARAEAFLVTSREVVRQLMHGELPKGEALGTARVAGIMAAKRTWELIPLCHPLPISKAAIDFEALGLATVGSESADSESASFATADSETERGSEGDAAGGTATAQMRVIAEITTRGVTGVEMEALTAASVAALTLYDMIKAVDKHAEITGTRVLAKSGGKSGDWELA